MDREIESTQAGAADSGGRAEKILSLQAQGVGGLINFDDISYDDHADLMYELAGQVVGHFQNYLSADETRKVLRCYQHVIARFVHSQMQVHCWEEAVGYELKVGKGFTEPKANTQITDHLVLAKKEAADQWCANATIHARIYGGNPYK